MKIEQDIILEIESKIKAVIPFDKVKFDLNPQIDPIKPDFVADVVFKNLHFSMVIEVISGESLSIFRDKLSRLKMIINIRPDLVPLIISKYLSPQKVEECKSKDINLMDLSGNVFFKHESIYIERVGLPNLFPEVRKGRNIFSDKASLIIRAMLQDNRIWGVRELANSIDIDAGYLSRMLKELEKQNYLYRLNNKFKLRNLNALFEEWVRSYDYKLNKEFKYFCLAKSAVKIIDNIKELRIPEDIKYALSFHAGAYLVSPHAVFNEVHIYVSDNEARDYFIRQLDPKPVDKGANLVLLYPHYKDSVFYGRQRKEGLFVVSDIQLYLDLYKYPLRGIEQAEHIYKKFLKERITEKENGSIR